MGIEVCFLVSPIEKRIVVQTPLQLNCMIYMILMAINLKNNNDYNKTLIATVSPDIILKMV